MLRELARWFRRGDAVHAGADALLAVATRAFSDGDLAAARDKISELLAVRPDHVAALQLQGAVLASLGESAAAIDSFRRALRRDPSNANLVFDYANALRLAGDRDEAEVQYRIALHRLPGSVDLHRSLGNLLMEMKRPGEALSAYRQALEIDPGDEAARRKMGLAAAKALDFQLIRDCFEPFLAGGQLTVEERYWLGVALLMQGHVAQATESLAATLAMAPDNYGAAQMLGFAHLFSGNWREGFRLLERRFGAMRINPEIAGLKVWIEYIDQAVADIPAWTEGGCEGKRLLLWTEQGLGDTIMMLRLLPVLLDKWGAASVTLLCHAPIAALAPAFRDVSFIAVDEDWKASGSEFDLHCSILSLPYLLDITPDSIPGTVPYLRATDGERARWQARIGKLRGLKVGIAWAGNRLLTLDSLRSLALEQLRPLLSCPDVAFVNLQKDDAAREELRSSGFPVEDWMDDANDLMQTAALIEGLDLVISVDTAVAHLAGALGKRVWLLNRFESEWRWMRDREDSVWYPSMRIFSQIESRQWAPVIERMAGELRALASKKAGLSLLEQGRSAEAIPFFRRALDTNPSDRDALAWLGQVLVDQLDYREAEPCLTKAHGLAPLDTVGRYLLGRTLLNNGKLDEAVRIVEEALRAEPHNASLEGLLALAHLTAGNWREGFRLYETRHRQVRDNPGAHPMAAWLDVLDRALVDVPAWRGESLAGKRLLVWKEQGLGDAIMMMRFLPILRRWTGALKVTFLAPPELERLTGYLQPEVAFQRADGDWGPAAGDYDAHCSIMSLPHIMGAVPDRIPGDLPYIAVPGSASAPWQAPGRFRVGIAWAGNPALDMDRLRSVALPVLAPVLSCPGVEFVSLQKDGAAREALRQSGMPITDWMDRCSDIADTAGLIASLDLVISVDTAVAHLAGAIGKPVWLLNRFESEWRWMRDRESSVWYPTMRIFNQAEDRDWAPVIERIAGALSTELAARISSC